MTAAQKLKMFDDALTAYINTPLITITITKKDLGNGCIQYTNDRDDFATISLKSALAYVDHNYNFDAIKFD